MVATLPTKVYLRCFFGIVLTIMGGLLLVNLVVDPFNRNGWVPLPLPKGQVSLQAHYRLYRIVAFRNTPRTFLLFGDSRGALIGGNHFPPALRQQFFNFSYGGGTIPEMLDSFWFALDHARPEKIIFCLPFTLFNELATTNLAPEAMTLANRPLNYYLSGFVFQISLRNLHAAIRGQPVRDETPPMDEDSFWRFQLDTSARIQLGNYQYPTGLLVQLKRATEKIHSLGITPLFWLPPVHVDLQQKYADYGLTQAYARYKQELMSLGDVLDCDNDTPFTRDRANFSDPYHFKRELSPPLEAALLGAPVDFCTMTRWGGITGIPGKAQGRQGQFPTPPAAAPRAAVTGSIVPGRTVPGCPGRVFAG